MGRHHVRGMSGRVGTTAGMVSDMFGHLGNGLRRHVRARCGFGMGIITVVAGTTIGVGTGVRTEARRAQHTGPVLRSLTTLRLRF